MVLERENSILTDAEKLGIRADELDVRKQGRLCQEITLKLKRIIKEQNLNALSGPQIGYPWRIFCAKFGQNDIRTFINPIISQAGKLGLSKETCTSLPGQTFIRPRNSSVTIIYQTPLGKPTTAKLVGTAAIKIQHQIDHLDGLLLSDVGLPMTDDFDNYTKEEQEEILKGYLDSLDIRYQELEKEIESDEKLKELNNGIKFMEAVAKGDTKITIKYIPKEEVNTDN